MALRKLRAGNKPENCFAVDALDGALSATKIGVVVWRFSEGLYLRDASDV